MIVNGLEVTLSWYFGYILRIFSILVKGGRHMLEVGRLRWLVVVEVIALGRLANRQV